MFNVQRKEKYVGLKQRVNGDRIVIFGCTVPLSFKPQVKTE